MIAIAVFVVGCKKSAADPQKPLSAPDSRQSPQATPIPSASAVGERYLARRLDVLLRLLYACKEKEGWEFFDKAYTLPDADRIKAIVNEEIQQAPAYKFIRKRSSI
jgi:hypothetical protein